MTAGIVVAGSGANNRRPSRMNPLIRREFFGILRSPKAFAMLMV